MRTATVGLHILYVAIGIPFCLWALHKGDYLGSGLLGVIIVGNAAMAWVWSR
jgi:hypothetical protein